MTGENYIKIILTDDHTLIRDGLKSLLYDDDEVRIIGEASNGKELLELLKTTPADIVLMDINMPVMDGFQATKEVVSLYPDVKVIALSMLNNEPFVQRMIENGAMGYILKSAGREELKTAIKLVATGTPYLCSDLSLNMLHRRTTQEVPLFGKESSGEFKKLSKRELEVLNLIAEGYTNAEIADKLFTSKRTIETHRQNIMEKTKAKNTANLIKQAFQFGILNSDAQIKGI